MGKQLFSRYSKEGGTYRTVKTALIKGTVKEEEPAILKEKENL